MRRAAEPSAEPPPRIPPRTPPRRSPTSLAIGRRSPSSIPRLLRARDRLREAVRSAPEAEWSGRPLVLLALAGLLAIVVALVVGAALVVSLLLQRTQAPGQLPTGMVFSHLVPLAAASPRSATAKVRAPRARTSWMFETTLS